MADMSETETTVRSVQCDIADPQTQAIGRRNCPGKKKAGSPCGLPASMRMERTNDARSAGTDRGRSAS